MDFTKFMNKFNEIERQLSPTSALRLSFDNISPETEEPENKRLWGVPVPPFVSDKVVSWIEEEFTEPPIFFNDVLVLKKVSIKNPGISSYCSLFNIRKRLHSQMVLFLALVVLNPSLLSKFEN